MLGPGLLNLGSLALGLMAWTLPVVYLVRHGKADHRRWVVLTVASVSACATSLWMQILYTSHLVEIEDWSALLDTSRAVALAATVLLVVAVALNAITLVIHFGKDLQG